MLDLHGNFVSEASAVYLCEQLSAGIRAGAVPAFHTLSLSANTLGPAVLPGISAVLAASTTLTSLSLSNLFDPLTDADGAALMEGLQANQSLTSLDLSGNGLSNKCAWALRGALWAHTRLEALNLECNLISDDSAFFIAEALLKNPRNALRTLRLGWNRVGHVGLGCLLEAAGSPHSRLRAVDVRHNAVARLDSGAVMESVARSASLTSLNLSGNRLADLTEIGLGLHYNRALTELDASDNLLADDAFGWFALWRRPAGSALRSLDLRRNKLGDEAAAALAQGLLRHGPDRVLTRVELGDNLIDPLLASAVAALLNPFRPAALNAKEAKGLLKAKQAQDRAYWKERDWEARYRRKEAALEEARRKLQGRAADEEATGVVVGEPAIARVPVLGRVAAAVHEWVFGVPPSWRLQRQVLLEQRARVARDVALRRGLQGPDLARPVRLMKS